MKNYPAAKLFSSQLINNIQLLNERSSISAIIAISMDYALISLVIALYLVYPHWYTYVISIIVIGSRFRALENLLHEASHFHLFRNKRVNDVIGLLLCACPTGSSLQAYRQSHFSHHRWLGSADKDPDLQRYIKIGIDDMPFSKKRMFWQIIKIVTLIEVPRYVASSLKSFVWSGESTSYGENILRIVYYSALILIFTLAHVWFYALIFWLIPLLTTFQIIRYLAEISEHGGLYKKYDHTLFLTRNNFCHPLLRAILYPHADYFHLVHHLFPAVPWRNLHKAHALLSRDDGYKQAVHCYGYFFKTNTLLPSTLSMMIRA